MFIEEFNDDMHRIIVDRLRERNRKIKAVERFEKPDNDRVPVYICGLLVAACFAGVIYIISLNNSQGDMDAPIRSGMEHVRTLVDEGKYKEALQEAERELFIADSILNVRKKSTVKPDEETLYEIKALELKKEDLAKECEAIRRNMR